MQKEITETKTVETCDYCDSEVALIKCYFCGADICPEHTAVVSFYDIEPVRGKDIYFLYNKPMCKAHLPERRDCE
jgi:hypothetical protein